MSRAIRIGEDYLASLYDPDLELTEEFGGRVYGLP